MSPGVTVLICTYNGAKNLPETLKHLANQKVSKDIDWEVIVIDNGSTDDTSAVAAAEWAKYQMSNVEFKILDEAKPGKNYAFRQGIKSASFGYVLTCDDDNWLNDNYIESAFRIMISDGSIGALGGLGVIEAEEPTLIPQEDLKKLTVSGSQTWALSDHWVYGAGSLYRTDILITLFDRGWKPITSGRTGVSLICGEDVEICLMIHLCGFKVIADDTLIFKHYVSSKKQSKKFILDMVFWVTYSNTLLNSYYTIIHSNEIPIKTVINKLFLTSAKNVAKLSIRLFLRKFLWWKTITDEEIELLKATFSTFSALVNNSNIIINHNGHIKQVLENMGNKVRK